MPEESLVCEGIVDVGLIIISHFENPARKIALRFLKKVLSREIKVLIPTSVFLGAAHVMIEYLKLPRISVIECLNETLGVGRLLFMKI